MYPSQIYATLLILSLYLARPICGAPSQISSNSVLVALIDSLHFTEFTELVEKALLLQTLEGQGEEDKLVLTRGSLGEKYVGGLAKVTRPDDVVRFDGVVHGIDRLLVPRVVVEEFNKRRSLREISAVLPEGAPVVDPRTNRLKKNSVSSVPAGAPPVLPVYNAMAPGPSLAPAPAPGPGGAHRHFDGESQVKDFIQTLLHYGGYNELADILVNLTSLATEMGKLISEGYVLTVLAPNDEAMAKLTTDQLSDPGAPEQIVYYHLIPEYQTEESMYNSVRRFGKVQYDTLRLPHKVVAEEADGSVKFGSGEESAYLFDPDIYTDGRISVQGIDGVLFPMEEKAEKNATEVDMRPQVKVVAKQNRVYPRYAALIKREQLWWFSSGDSGDFPLRARV
nr:fasciclin-like arabinogalactan protein 17 [Tanacetum cinerariifolium]